MKRSAPFALVPLLAAAARAQESDAVFDTPLVAFDEFSRVTDLADLDGDGDLDALGAWFDPNSATDLLVRSYFNDGDGRFVPGWSIPLSLAGGSYSPLGSRFGVGDLDLDGVDDFVFSLGPALRYYLSNGASPPTLWATVNEPSGIDDLVAADFDGDGRTDVALASFVTLRILLTGPAGPVTPGATGSLGPGTTHRLFVAQVEADGLPDVGIAGFSTGTQLRLVPVAAGVPGTPLAFTLPFATNPLPMSGDVDGDADADVVVFNPPQYWIARRTGPAAFTLEAPVLGGPATGLADVDGDGDLDGVCCGGGGGGATPNGYNSTFEISINQGGAFAAAFPITGLGATKLAGAVDVDADGDVDLVAGRCVYYGHGPLLARPSVPGGNTDLLEGKVHDTDRDGDPDLQFGVGTGFRNAADGSFAWAPPLVPAAAPGETYWPFGWPGDFDGDGDADLVVEHGLSSGPFLSMRLLRNAGGGALIDGGDAATAGENFRLFPSAPWAIASMLPDACVVADADGDGDLDLLPRTTGASRIWWNDGTGFFSAGPEFLYEFVKRVADVDGDGDPDLLSLAMGAPILGQLRVLRGLGAGAFAPPDPAPVFDSQAPNDRFDLADFDGDGDLDAVGPDGIAWVLRANDGNGTFLPAGTVLPAFATNATNRRAFAGDLNGDGAPDLLLYPARDGGGVTAQIHAGTGAPFGFAPVMRQILAPGALADADGDGDPDSLGVSIVKGREFVPPSSGVRVQYGTPLAGAGGMAPTLGGVGPFRPGSACETRITGTIGGTIGVLAIGFQPLDLPLLGGTLLADPLLVFPVSLGGVPGYPGQGILAIPWVADASMIGATIFQQAGVLDPEAPQGIALTNGLRYTIGS